MRSRGLQCSSGLSAHKEEEGCQQHMMQGRSQQTAHKHFFVHGLPSHASGQGLSMPLRPATSTVASVTSAAHLDGCLPQHLQAYLVHAGVCKQRCCIRLFLQRPGQSVKLTIVHCAEQSPQEVCTCGAVSAVRPMASQDRLRLVAALADQK